MVNARRAAKAANSSSHITMEHARTSTSTPRTSPFVPTPFERYGLLLFPAVLVFGTIFSILSPETSSAPYDHVAQAHVQDIRVAPSYFALKSNIFNVVFVKRGWAWITVSFMLFIFTHPSTVDAGRRLRAVLRWAAVTTIWILVTQWCFGPALIDRGFRWTGGRCELARREIEMGDSGLGEMVTSVACKAAGGKWKGGHDISGHVFLLTLGTAFLLQEVGWAIGLWLGLDEERCVVMSDGALKSANVEAQKPQERVEEASPSIGVGGRFAVGVMGLSVWMLLMTAIYFHTWFEKFTGLLTAAIGFYVVYIVPRFVPAVRQVIGLPGI